MSASKRHGDRGVTEAEAEQAQLLVSQITAAACQGWGQTWSAAEAAYLHATDLEEARKAAATVTWLCEECPLRVRALCSNRALVDRYTGLADGAVWTNGSRQPVGTVLAHPGARPQDLEHLPKAG